MKIIKTNLAVLILLLVSVIPVHLTACGSFPLVLPENQSDSSVEQNTPEVIDGGINSPLAVPTTSTELSLENESPSEPTPVYSPTPAPDPIPTATFEPLSNNFTLGFVFGPPQELQTIDNSKSLNLIGWVPGNTNDMIVVGDGFVDLVNIQTETTQRLFEWNPEIRFIVDEPVLLPSSQTIALISGNFQTSQYELWVISSQEDSPKQPYLSNIERSFIPVTTGNGLNVYNLDTQTLMSIHPNSRETSQVEAVPLQESPAINDAEYKAFTFKNLIAYYDQKELLIVDADTNEIKKVHLPNEKTTIWKIQWSLDGSKLALLLSEGPPPFNFLNLYVYDLNNDELQEIQTPFSNFIDEVAWGPDSRHIMVSAVIDEAEYRTPNGDTFVSNKNVLFLVDTATMKNSPVPILEPNEASVVGEILWSPDGEFLVARYRFYQGGIVTYRIQVKHP